jgi:DNA-binding transcriptional LysR family regulator
MLGAAEALRRDLIEIGAGERDRIIVGGSLAYATYVLPAVLAAFQQAHPNVWISAVDGRSGDTIEGIRTGALDAAVVSSSRVPRSSGDELFVAALGTDDLIVIEGAGAPFSAGQSQPLRVTDLAAIPFVRISRRRSLPATLDPFLARAGLGPVRAVMELGTWEGVKDAVRVGLGAAVVFRSVVLHELARGELREVRIEGFHQSRELALICSPRRRHERMTEVFQDLLAHIENAVPASLEQNL